MSSDKRHAYSITLPDGAKLEALRTVLAYESAVRGLGLGATLVSLLLQSADVERYPEELHDMVMDFDEELRREVDGAVSDYMRARESA